MVLCHDKYIIIVTKKQPDGRFLRYIKFCFSVYFGDRETQELKRFVKRFSFKQIGGNRGKKELLEEITVVVMIKKYFNI